MCGGCDVTWVCSLLSSLAFTARPARRTPAAVPVLGGGWAGPPDRVLAPASAPPPPGPGRLGRLAGGAGAWASGFWGVGVEDAGQEVGWDGAVAVGVALQLDPTFRVWYFAAERAPRGGLYAHPYAHNYSQDFSPG